MICKDCNELACDACGSCGGNRCDDRWIKCSDRMPVYNDMVLVYGSYGYQLAYLWEGEDRMLKHGIKHYPDCWRSYGSKFKLEDICQWMPLPDPSIAHNEE
jgi:Protein of unknown function (DUF551)